MQSHPTAAPAERDHRPLRVASRNVLRNPRAYVSFLLALLVIQTLLCLLLSTAAIDLRTTADAIDRGYDYDILLRGISQPQYAVIHNTDLAIPEDMREEYPLPYSALRYEELESGDYNVYITLQGEDVTRETEQLAAGMLNSAAALGELNVDYSPRYHRAAHLGSLYLQLVLCTLLLLALAVFLMVLLQRTRLHHEKYQYGIYMTFGAGFRQLFGTSAGELWFIVLLTTLPALLLGTLLCVLLCVAVGTTWSPSLLALLLSPLLTALVAWISVFFPTKHLSRQTPLELLTARDNSNLVVSPRRSLRLFGRSFPFTYELFSLWRYRRYLAGLLLATMLFASLWLGLVRIADYNDAKVTSDAPEYTVQTDEFPPVLTAMGVTIEDLALSLEQLDGVERCEYRQALPIMELRGFMAVSSAAARRAGSYTVSSRDVSGADFPRATNAVRYIAYDAPSIDRLIAQSECIEGDPYAVLEDDRSVILSVALNNTRRFDFSPGDTVLLATNKMTSFTQILTNNNLDLLRMMLAEEEFHLEEYTVCAVIRDEESDELLSCGLNFDTYRALTGQTPYATELSVYLAEEVGTQVPVTLDAAVQRTAAAFHGARVTSHDTHFLRSLALSRNLSARITAAAYLLLAMMPLFSVFSQRVFYGKREREWFLLKTLGAPRIARKRLLLCSAIILTATHFLAMLPLGLLADFLAFKLCNEWLPAGGFVTPALMHYRLSPLVIPVLLLFALLCGALPCLPEYLRLRAALLAEDQPVTPPVTPHSHHTSKEDPAHVSEKKH